MEEKKSSIGVKIGIALACLVAIFMVVTFNMMAFDNLAEVVEYNDKSNELVEAVITKANEVENTDDHYWCSFVSYTYNGVEYKDVPYDNPSAEPHIGTEVLVYINPENPGEIVPDEDDARFSGISSFIVLSIIIVGLYIFIGAVITRFLEKRGSEKSGAAEWIPAVILAVKQTIESVYFYKQHDSYLYAIFSAIIFVILIIFIVYANKKKSNPENEAVNQTENVQK